MKTIALILLLTLAAILSAQQVIVFRRAPVVSGDQAGDFNGSTSSMKG